MAPTLCDGDYVITFKLRLPKIGKIYIINHSDLGRIIKRLKDVDGDGRLIFAGDNPVSNSGDILGRIKKERIIARAFVKITKSSIGWL